jgi:hypothetical protein
VPLQGPQVVVHLLPGQADAGGEHGRGGGFGQLGQEAGADGVQRHLGRGRVLDDRHLEHGGQASLDNFSCQELG